MSEDKVIREKMEEEFCMCSAKEYVLDGTNWIPIGMRNIYIATASVEKNQNASVIIIPQGSSIGCQPLKCHELTAGDAYTMTVGNIFSFTGSDNVVYAYKFKDKHKAILFWEFLKEMGYYISITLKEGRLFDLDNKSIEFPSPAKKESFLLQEMYNGFLAAPGHINAAVIGNRLLDSMIEWEISETMGCNNLRRCLREMEYDAAGGEMKKLRDSHKEIIVMKATEVMDFFKRHDL